MAASYSVFRYKCGLSWNELKGLHANNKIRCNGNYSVLVGYGTGSNTNTTPIIYLLNSGSLVVYSLGETGYMKQFITIKAKTYLAPGRLIQPKDKKIYLEIRLYNDGTNEVVTSNMTGVNNIKEKTDNFLSDIGVDINNKVSTYRNKTNGYITCYVLWDEVISKCICLTTESEIKQQKTTMDGVTPKTETNIVCYNKSVNVDIHDGAEPLVDSSSTGNKTNTKNITNSDGAKAIQEQLEREGNSNLNGILSRIGEDLKESIEAWINNDDNIATKSKKYRESLGKLDIKKLRAVFGLPYQFLPSADLRIDGSYTDHVFGTVYSDMIASRMNLLHLTPCNSSFMANYSTAERKSLLGNIISFFGSGDTDNLANLTEDYAGKLYSTIPAYSEYFKYVNPMIRSCSIFLGLYQGSEKYANDQAYLKYKGEYLAGTTSKSFNWAWNDMTGYTGDYSGNDDGGSNNNGFSKIVSDFSQFQETLYYKNSVPFYITNSASISETFTNETTESMIASVLNGFSDKARELQFLVGTTSRAIASTFDKLGEGVNTAKETVEGLVNNLSSGNNIFSQLVGGVRTIVTGGRLMFPNIWSNSTYGKSYTINIKLTTPSPDPKSILLNILAPLCHLCAFVFPRGEYVNGYSAPFLVKAFCKGQFNIDMGIITDMSFEKGKEGTWTIDGLPTVVDVTMTITDLYPTMSMSPSGPLFKSNVLKNIAEMDFLANLCGVNINQPDLGRIAVLYEVLNISNPITDFVPNLESDILNWATNKAQSIFGRL